MRFLAKVLCSVGLALVAGAVTGAEPELFDNPTAGFQVTKPAEWHYITAAQYTENLKAIKLSDEEFHAAMQKYATAPLVAMSRFPEPFDDVNPSFKVNLKPYGGLKGKRPEEIIGLLLPQFQQMFKDFALVQPPIEVEVSGIRSGYVRMNYTMEVPDGRGFPTTSELWIVPHGDYFFLIGAGTRQDEKTGTREEIQEILKSVRIASQP